MIAWLSRIERDNIEHMKFVIIPSALHMWPPPSMPLAKFMMYLSVDKKVVRRTQFGIDVKRGT